MSKLGFLLVTAGFLAGALGMLLRIFIDWWRGLRYSEEVGIPVAAGFIVGEGLMGVGFAVYSVVAGMMGR